MNPSSPAVRDMVYDERPRSFRRPIVTTIIMIMLVIMIIRDILVRRRRAAADLLLESGQAMPTPRPGRVV